MPQAPSTFPVKQPRRTGSHGRSLARRLRRAASRAREILATKAAAAIAAEDDDALAAAIDEAATAAAEDMGTEEVANATRAAATAQSQQQQRSWYASLAMATGAALIVRAASGSTDEYEPPAAAASTAPLRGAQLLIVPTPPSFDAESVAQEAADLISLVNASVADATAQAVLRARERGLSPQELAAELAQQWRNNGVPAFLPTRRMTEAGQPVLTTLENHAALVARDQLLKLAAAEEAQQQADAGVEEFRWQSMGGPNARRAHLALSGQVFSWSEGAGGLYPGQAVNCHCQAIAMASSAKVLAAPNVLVVRNPGAPVEMTRVPARAADVPGWNAQTKLVRAQRGLPDPLDPSTNAQAGDVT